MMRNIPLILSAAEAHGRVPASSGEYEDDR